MESLNTYEHFNRYKLENIRKMFLAAVLIYPSMAFSDYSLAKGDFWFFLGSRFAFLLPYAIIFFSYKRIQSRHVDYYGFVIFIGLAMGASIPSYFFGGLSSDYYFGIAVISFIQFITMPLKIGQTIILETLFMLIYFPINILPFEHDQILITKQLSNYLSFALVKIAVAKRFHTQMLESFKGMELQKKLEKKETVQIILGELCHLLNNPLFISTSLIKRLRKQERFIDEIDLTKAIEANERMNEILKEMLNVQEQNNLELDNHEVLKEFFKDTDLSTKAAKQ